MHSKAWFRATREMCGLSQQDVADALGVTVKSVKRWENPDLTGYSIPEEALDWMSFEEASFSDAIHAAFDDLDASGMKSVTLTYYRDQAQHDANTDDGERFGVANAVSRAVAAELMAEGIEVRWAYPE